MNTTEWIKFAPTAPPEVAGVYGFYLPELKQWLYVGQSTNIKKRFASRRHPYHLALSLAQPGGVLLVERAERRGRLEAALHRDLTPLGNGGVSTFSSHDCWGSPDALGYYGRGGLLSSILSLPDRE